MNQRELPDPSVGETWVGNDDEERVTIVSIEEPRHECSMVELRTPNGKVHSYTLRSLWCYHRVVTP